MKIYTKIFIGLILGAVVGILLSALDLSSWGGYFRPFGDAFINLIKMVVIPLVTASIILGVASLGDVRALGRIGLKTMAFYAVAISLAVTFGLFMANIFKPGAGLDEEKRDTIITEVQKEESFKQKTKGSEAAAAAIVVRAGRENKALLQEISDAEEVEDRHELALEFREEVKNALAGEGHVVAEGERPDELIIDRKSYTFLRSLDEPGEPVTTQFFLSEEAGRTRNIGDILLSLIPTNPIQSMAEGSMLPIIVFSIFFGIALTMINEGPRQKVVGVLEGVNDAMIVLVNIIMKLAPYGVFAIIVAVTATLGFEFLLSLIRYSLVTIGSMAIYLTVFYGAGVWVLGGISPIKFFKEMRPVMLIAFSTSSSNATLPENMRVCRDEIGVPKEVVSFSLPLGATVNMDGTAIYQGISAMFIAQVFGMPLTIEQQAMVVLTASLASIGAAGVPGIGMVTLAMVLASVNLPAAGIALVLGVERILDMCRTTLNVVGDACGAVIVGNSEGGIHPPAEAPAATE